MGAHTASLGVGCIWCVGACACAVTKEKDRQRDKERGAHILHGIELRMFHAFRCMLSYVSSRCCLCFIRMLYVLHLDIAYVAMARMLQVYVSNVSFVLDVCCKCFIWMLHMFWWLYTYVARVYSKHFISFRRMF
jgi:hypothetical protein